MKVREIMLPPQGTESAGSIAAKASPPLAVVGMQLAGLAIDDWIKWATLLYVVLMLLHKLWHMGLEFYRFWILKDKHPEGGDG